MGQLIYIPLYCIYLLLFLQLISKQKFFETEGLKPGYLQLFFLFKVVCGLVLTLIFTYYYTDTSKADIYRYFNDSKEISRLLFSHPLDWLKIMSGVGINDAGTFQQLQNTWHFTHPVKDIITSNALLIRIISVLNFLSFSNIYIDTLLINFIAFCGLVILYKILSGYYASWPQLICIPIFLVPSFVFFSSGLLKESILIPALALFLWGILPPANASTSQRLLAIIIGISIIVFTKIYVAFVLIAVAPLLPVRINPQTLNWVRIIVTVVIIALVSYAFNQGLCEKIIDKRNEFISLSVTEKSGTALESALLTPDCNNFEKLLPTGIINGMFRPLFPIDRNNFFVMIFGVENLLFFLLVACLLFGYFKKPDSSRAWLAAFFFAFAFFNFLGIGITVPVLGAIVHYRIIALPFLWLAIALLIDIKRLKFTLDNLLSTLNIKL